MDRFSNRHFHNNHHGFGCHPCGGANPFDNGTEGRNNYPATFINFGSEFSFTFNEPGNYSLNMPGLAMGVPFQQPQNTEFHQFQHQQFPPHYSKINVNSGPFEQYNQFNAADCVPPPYTPGFKSGESREMGAQREPESLFKPRLPRILKMPAAKRKGPGTPYPMQNPKNGHEHSISNHSKDLHSCSQCSYSSDCSAMSGLSKLTNTNNCNEDVFSPPKESQQQQGFVPVGPSSLLTQKIFSN